MKRKRWPSLSPRAILIITLATAAAVFFGGIYLARRDEQIHLPGHRKSIQTIGEEMEKESGQLERLYAKDLRHLVSATLNWTDAPPKISELCDSVVGVAQWSLIHGMREAGNDRHIPADPASTIQWPRPTFQINPDDLHNDELLLSKDDLM